MEREQGSFYLGHQLEAGERTDPLLYDSSDLTTHGVIVGMTGSGKTGLGVVLLRKRSSRASPYLRSISKAISRTWRWSSRI